MSFKDLLPGRAAEATGTNVPDEPELVEQVEHARDELLQVQRAAEINTAAARARLETAQGALDEWRRGLVQAHAVAWRRAAERLRERAVAAGDATQIVSILVFSMNGSYTKPELVFTRNVLNDQGLAADQTAQHLENRLANGDDLAGEQLSLLVSQLEPLPDAELVPV